jgi:hypothetical protein
LNTHRRFFLFALPAGWAALSLLHFHFPGDEYGLWAVSSMAGTWITFLLPSVGDIHQPWIRFSVAATGALVTEGVFLPDGTFLPLPKLATEPFLKLWEEAGARAPPRREVTPTLRSACQYRSQNRASASLSPRPASRHDPPSLILDLTSWNLRFRPR